uniref:Uncharacterized protein n=1 Tax=Candidatus Kentrum sp. UNK TaxID=2126344 RepID=A0A451AAM1_9GAMM|nr:MAG: hypothetical protein BECKUNK1418G_GA0071005_102915 [Candidatus Kentron sp. UNK]VFK70714.1 MAG: hypothetical protein BECKUNK1418H_GA0071006_103615 [Candidatus Kentron sp. UNK]
MGVYSTPPLDFFKNEEPKGRVFLEAMMQSAQIWLYIWGIFATLFLIAIFLFPPWS